jgi:hypothetical protein
VSGGHPLPPDDLFEECPDSPAPSEQPISWEPTKPKVKPPARATRVQVGDIEHYRRDIEHMIPTGEWSEAGPGHIVSLYAWCHEKVYGIYPSELTNPFQYAKAMDAVRDISEYHFDGDPAECVAFVRWSWKREEDRERWRRDNGKSGSRLVWRFQFNDAMVTDYLLDIARRRKGGLGQAP